MSDDRTVHATDTEGWQLVRYDRAGKWFLEPPADSQERRRHLSVQRAAVTAIQPGWEPVFGLPGGGEFDRLISNLKETNDT